MNDAEQYRRAKGIFFEACERAPAERLAFLESACAGDASLRTAVMALLRDDANPLTMMGRPVRDDLDALLARASGADNDREGGGPGAAGVQRIDGYRILGKLGEGGMGIVYLAEQQNPRRQVALKVVATGTVSRHTLRRFEHEAHILGRLHHPGIAQVYEAGTFDAGRGAQPFFAMELVRGRSLLRFCEESKADVRGRLELFLAMCDAVQHAHQQGVIHRDLKPANIIVEEGQVAGDQSDGPKPVCRPKILDFGVARLTDSDVHAPSMHTAADQLIGTLAYMSPEQLSGLPDDIDTRSDVYALGVILFEMLAGRLPHNVTNKTVPETIRIIGQDEPASLSSIDRAFRGDLDTIVRKAMERDKARRYQSAGELAADVQRYLRDEPIAARPPSTLYQFHKFARRNKAVVTGIAVVFVVLVAGIVATTWQARQAIKARDEQIGLRKKADSSALRASAANAFLRRMLASAQPEETQGRDVSVGTVLDAAAAEIGGGTMASQPDVEALIQHTIGETYLAIGRVPEARAHLERALQLSRQEHGENSAEVGAVLMTLASLTNSEGDRRGATALDEQALTMLRGAHGGDHADIANCLANLAEYYLTQGQRESAVALKRESLEMLRRLDGDDSMEVADARARLAGILHGPDEAEPLLRDAVATYRAALGEQHPKYIRGLRQLAGVLAMRRAYDQAAATYLRALELGKVVYKPDHPDNLVMLQELGFCYQLAGQAERSLAVCNEVVEMARRIYGEDSMRFAESILDRADVRDAQGDRAGSLADNQQALAIARQIGQDSAPRVCIARLEIAAELLAAGGDAAEALTLLHEVLSNIQNAPPSRQWMHGEALSLLGVAALERKSYAEAEPLLLQGYERLGTSSLVVGHRRKAAARLVRLYEEWDAAEPGAGHAQRAEPWRLLAQKQQP